MRLQAYEAGILGARWKPAPRRLCISREMEAVYRLTVQDDRYIGASHGDLILIPLANRVNDKGTIGRTLEGVDGTGPVDRRIIRPGQFIDLNFKTEVDAKLFAMQILAKGWSASAGTLNPHQPKQIVPPSEVERWADPGLGG